ncbi:hypothetical protein [Trichocoleus sp. FACHB-262]|uniref:hypothetical protein n=1 Tax=Trichocoleus sp. FACHB-262 TaxID=2692869 RepID=UPI001F54F627|nr:hypothetical protein [Trichocoleus sp. FACHB-262]
MVVAISLGCSNYFGSAVVEFLFIELKLQETITLFNTNLRSQALRLVEAMGVEYFVMIQHESLSEQENLLAMC